MYGCGVYRLTDRIEMGLFILRYVSSLMVFALGLKAPGIAGDMEPQYRAFGKDPTARSRYYQVVSYCDIIVRIFC